MVDVVARLCDMREGNALQLFIEDDGDVIVSVIPEDGIYAKGVQFCLSGGQSKKTLWKLHELFDAMKEDEEKLPQSVGMQIDD